MEEKELIEIEQLYEQWRHRDKLLWSSAPISLTIAGILVAVAYQYVPDSEYKIRALIITLAIIWVFTMVVMLCKNMIYQKGTEELLGGKDIVLHKPNDFSWYFKPFSWMPAAYELVLLVDSILILALCYMLADILNLIR